MAYRLPLKTFYKIPLLFILSAVFIKLMPESINEQILSFGRKLAIRFPQLHPLLVLIKQLFFSKPVFSGWGMKTIHALPWVDDLEYEDFLMVNEEIKDNFSFQTDQTHVSPSNFDEMLWRHWIVSFSVLHALKFSKTSTYSFAECGVSVGFSSFFALHQIKKHLNTKFIFHLYDSWDTMRENDLVEDEKFNVGRYKGLQINVTKKNLSKFMNNLVFHKGYIPESFTKNPKPPTSLVFLHIDLNSKKATIEALRHLAPRIVSGGIILFDDYGDRAFVSTKLAINKFLKNKNGSLLKLPTGQAIFFNI